MELPSKAMRTFVPFVKIWSSRLFQNFKTRRTWLGIFARKAETLLKSPSVPKLRLPFLKNFPNELSEFSRLPILGWANTKL